LGRAARVFVLALGLVVAPGGPAALARAPTRAAATNSPGSERALELFEQSARSYREGRFQEAVDKLLEARRLKPEPVLLYNLARAYEALGRSDAAADAYSQYLVEEPSPTDRKAIEARITNLRAQAAELAAARKAEARPNPAPTDGAPPKAGSDQEEPPPRPPNDGVVGVLPWVLAGVGVAALGTGVVLGVVARGMHDEAVAEPQQRAAAETQNDAEDLALVSTVTMIAGAVVAAVGIAWLVVRSTRPPSRSSSSSLSRSAPTLRDGVRTLPRLVWSF
jgi:tetratricopeptide (TPR) repeat protein